MEHLLQIWSKYSILHNIFKYMIFQRRQKALLWSKGLKYLFFIFQTYIGDILVAVNPCKPLPLFDVQVSVHVDVILFNV